MQERLRGYANDIQGKWNGLERNQRIKLIGIVLLFVITLGVTIYLTTRPRMYKLFTNLEYSTIGQIQRALDDAGIYNRLADGGTAIEVNEKDADTAAVELSLKNVPSGGTFTYADALSYSGMGTTETIKKENLLRARQSDLSASLRMFEGVDSAIVTLVMPNEDNYFQETTQEPSASVALKLSKSLTKEQGNAIALYIARSVKNLSMDKIEIRDQHANIIYSGDQEQNGSLGSQLDIENKYKSDLSAMIRGTLAPMYDDVKANTHLKMNWDKVLESEKQYSNPMGSDVDTGLVSRRSAEDQAVTNGTVPVEPGVNANDQANVQYDTQNGTESNASIKRDDSEYLHNERTRTIETSVGDIITDESSVSVTVYKYITYNEEDMTNDRLGDMTWEDYKAANWEGVRLNIDEGVFDTIRKSTGIEDVAVYGYQIPIFVDMEKDTPIRVEQIITFIILALLILMLAYGLIRSTQPVEVTEIEPELSVEDLLVSTQLEEQKEAEADELQGIDFSKESESKKQIEKFVYDNPEAVAQLLRNWLNEGWDS